MYYRRKVLLALVEVFDGNLNSTDCEKFLFYFCKNTGKNLYDFFPYRYGPFSFVSYYDKRRLIEMGLLKQTQDFQLNTKHSFLEELQPSDKRALHELKMSGLRGNYLVRKTYLENPSFTVNSEILETLFEAQEIKKFRSFWNVDETPYVYSLGYEGLTIDAFLNKLIMNNIQAVVDIRNNPQSMKYGFSKKSFSDYIKKAGMTYIHIPELGIPSAIRKGLGIKVSYEQLFRLYETDILHIQQGATAHLLDLIATYPRVALVCFEADHHFCHRHTLVEYLQKAKTLTKPVKHL